MHGLAFLQDLAVVMIVAALVTVTFRQLRLPVVLGYIIAGLIIGPHTPPLPLISDPETIQTLADLGVIFMMLSLGLEFDLRKLRKVGLPALIAALFEIPLMLFVGYTIGRAFGWSAMDSLFLGAIVSISSTTIIIKTFGELRITQEAFTGVVFGILIFEDIVAVLMLALLSTIAMTGGFALEELGSTVGRLGLFLSISLVLGFVAVPRLLAYIARFKSNEMLLVSVLGLCFGMSLLAVKLGFSAALGAFVIGAIVAESRQSGRIEILTEPIRDMFGAVFFVAIGLLIDPMILLEQTWPILALTFAVVAGKLIGVTLGSFFAGHDRRTALRTGMSMAQIGEFSFIIAGLGVSLGVTRSGLYPIAVAVSVLTTLLTPFLIRGSDGLVRRMERSGHRGALAHLDLYTAWAGRALSGAARTPSQVQPILKRVAVNLVLISAVFVGAAFVARWAPGAFAPLPRWSPSWGTSLWLGAVILCGPLFIGTTRKLWMISRLVADSTATGQMRAVVAPVLMAGSLAGFALLILILSTAILPPKGVLLGTVLLMSGLALIFRGQAARAYGRIQELVHDTLERPAPAHHGTSTGLQRALPSLLEAARFEKVLVLEGTTAAGRMLEELGLRRRTGASVVAIERGEELIVNPPPDQPLLSGDRVLVLGSEEQVGAARELLEGKA